MWWWSILRDCKVETFLHSPFLSFLCIFFCFPFRSQWRAIVERKREACSIQETNICIIIKGTFCDFSRSSAWSMNFLPPLPPLFTTKYFRPIQMKRQTRSHHYPRGLICAFSRKFGRMEEGEGRGPEQNNISYFALPSLLLSLSPLASTVSSPESLPTFFSFLKR